MCKLTGDYNTTLPSNQTREPVHFAEMLCLVCLAAWPAPSRMSRAMQKQK
jgi:hypothetical protein